MTNQNKIIIIAAGAILLIIGGFYLFGKGRKVGISQETARKERVINENLKIPDTVSFTGMEGRIVEQGNVAIALVPKNDAEKVIVPNAALSVKGAYDLAEPEARKWSPDAKLVFIKSLGAITLEGRSSQWQIAFSSGSKKGRGYEIIVQKDGIVSQKEVASAAAGGALPDNFSGRDSAWALAQLALIPQFQTASVSAIVFSYNADAKGWDYIIPNSFGKSAIRVR